MMKKNIYTKMMKNNPIGFFDSGLGGISILKEAKLRLPNENLIYYGDSKNAPYGLKTKEEILKLSTSIVDFLLEKGAKAIVISCNTATMACIEELKLLYKDVTFIGTYPLVDKLIDEDTSKILVLGTPFTISKIKKDDETFIFRDLDGIVELVEKFDFNEEKLFKIFDDKILDVMDLDIKKVSLSCTHYPFFKEYLEKYFKLHNKEVKFFDGAQTTVDNLINKLNELDVLNDSKEMGYIEIYNSKNDDVMIEKSFELLDR